MERKAKVVVIEQPHVQKHAHQINEYQQESKSAGLPIGQKRRETLKGVVIEQP